MVNHFFLANIPTSGWIYYHIEQNFTPSCFHSWSTGVMERYLPMWCYFCMEVYADKAWKRTSIRPRIVDLSFIVIFNAKTSLWYALIIWLFFEICLEFSLLLFSKADFKRSLSTKKPFKNNVIEWKTKQSWRGNMEVSLYTANIFPLG